MNTQDSDFCLLIESDTDLPCIRIFLEFWVLTFFRPQSLTNRPRSTVHDNTLWRSGERIVQNRNIHTSYVLPPTVGQLPTFLYTSPESQRQCNRFQILSLDERRKTLKNSNLLIFPGAANTELFSIQYFPRKKNLKLKKSN